MIYYAVLNETNICSEIRGLHEEVNKGNYILLDMENFSLIGKKYNSGVWEEVEYPTPEPLSTTEQAIFQTVINTEYMMSLMEVKG